MDTRCSGPLKDLALAADFGPMDLDPEPDEEGGEGDDLETSDELVLGAGGLDDPETE